MVRNKDNSQNISHVVPSSCQSQFYSFIPVISTPFSLNDTGQWEWWLAVSSQHSLSSSFVLVLFPFSTWNLTMDMIFQEEAIPSWAPFHGPQFLHEGNLHHYDVLHRLKVNFHSST